MESSVLDLTTVTTLFQCLSCEGLHFIDRGTVVGIQRRNEGEVPGHIQFRYRLTPEQCIAGTDTAVQRCQCGAVAVLHEGVWRMAFYRLAEDARGVSCDLFVCPNCGGDDLNS